MDDRRAADIYRARCTLVKVARELIMAAADCSIYRANEWLENINTSQPTKSLRNKDSLARRIGIPTEDLARVRGLFGSNEDARPQLVNPGRQKDGSRKGSAPKRGRNVA